MNVYLQQFVNNFIFLVVFLNACGVKPSWNHCYSLFSQLGCGVLAAEISRNELAWKIYGLLYIFIPRNSQLMEDCEMLARISPLQKKLYPIYSSSTFFRKVKYSLYFAAVLINLYSFLLNWLLNYLNLCSLNSVTVKSLAVWSLMFQQLLSRLLLVVVLATLLEMTKFCAKVWNLILFIVKIGQRMLIHQMQSDANWWHSSYVQSLLQASW